MALIFLRLFIGNDNTQGSLNSGDITSLLSRVILGMGSDEEDGYFLSV